MKRVGVVLHAVRPEAASSAARVGAALATRGVETAALADDAARIGSEVVTADRIDDVDLVLAFGGDGTLLRAVGLVGGAPVPVLGVNLGHLGFLSGAEDDTLGAAIDALLERGFTVEERRLLSADVYVGGAKIAAVDALNDVIVEKERVGRSIRLSVGIGGEPVVSWAADGIIVATSTGSTAYSFSAGGPVVSPRVPCLIVTPVAPHGMFARTLIAPPDEEVVLRLAQDSDPAALSADGQPALPLAPGARIAARLSDRTAHLARLDPSPFWRLVREKFGLRHEGG